MSEMLICEKICGYNMFYLDKDWQKPVITEFSIFNNIRNAGILFDNYLAFPWATMIDKGISNIPNNYLEILSQYSNINGFTVCQHIHYKWLIPIWKILGIHTVFICHCQNDLLDINISNITHDIQLLPLNLYPNNVPEFVHTNNDIHSRQYLLSFIGSYNEQHYLTNIRQKIFAILSNPKYKDVYIKLRPQWHY